MGVPKKKFIKCKKPSCYLTVNRPEMVYCSRECAPLGNYGLAEDGIKIKDGKRQFYAKEKHKIKQKQLDQAALAPDWFSGNKRKARRLKAQKCKKALAKSKATR